MKGDLSKPRHTIRWKGKQRRIGITGGIASGKTILGRYLAEENKLPLLDADIYSRDVIAPGTSSTKKIIQRFGEKIILQSPDKSMTIDRRALRKIIFENKEEKIWLESLIHPKVITRIDYELNQLKQEPIVILIIPLLYELDLTYICSETWVIDCTTDQQLERLVQRDKMNMREALSMINSQMSLKEKKKFADVIISNKNEPEIMFNQAKYLLDHL